MSMLYTSFSSNSNSSTFSSGVSAQMMVRFPSITCFFSWWERTPCIGFTLKSSAIFAKASVTWEFLLPTCTRRRAASAAFQAAMMTSAFLSVTFSPPTMIV